MQLQEWISKSWLHRRLSLAQGSKTSDRSRTCRRALSEIFQQMLHTAQTPRSDPPSRGKTPRVRHQRTPPVKQIAGLRLSDVAQPGWRQYKPKVLGHVCTVIGRWPKGALLKLGLMAFLKSIEPASTRTCKRSCAPPTKTLCQLREVKEANAGQHTDYSSLRSDAGRCIGAMESAPLPNAYHVLYRPRPVMRQSVTVARREHWSEMVSHAAAWSSSTDLCW